MYRQACSSVVEWSDRRFRILSPTLLGKTFMLRKASCSFSAFVFLRRARGASFDQHALKTDFLNVNTFKQKFRIEYEASNMK